LTIYVIGKPDAVDVANYSVKDCYVTRSKRTRRVQLCGKRVSRDSRGGRVEKIV